MTRVSGLIGLAIGSVSFLLFFGCGTNLQSTLLLSGESGARTFVDILLSDLFAELPNLYTFPTEGDGMTGTDADMGADTCTGGDTGTGADTGGTAPPANSDPAAGLAGVAADGESLFTTNGCVGCHCPSTDTCSPGLIDLSGVGVARIREKVQGEGFHGGGKFPDLTDQDLADLAAFFAG